MIIQLKKFGTTLISRQAGKEALAAFQPVLNSVGENEKIEIDFEGVNTFTPSWGDEFLTPLQNKFGDRLTMKNTENSSVKATLDLLKDISQGKFIVEK
ncbi:MAG: hypothetical protein A2271_03745 [Candidatus Moranbacteria bacterium RIFOXYA12_FULL_35_19]|nr:MAG: hypothetical protein UR78_C0003G0021 [Candidatus Moranbacteria bacterium GW2011_GWF2_35_39]OGI31838.1 MAG: hypothetical protein A2343_01320 [Candidatus Moranbacteria bacterium RIFOXYB12_FULL_35_8]OGI33361.1 MAG: hypothetical protein A2489_03870 [Candidatus Moranbacteria bacterium RIFOXYC12_FULL_36_13]OGI36289.1 MAG: hypothetical protein A2271_03745 [Candidatus Moranbacteria bacterium RIFOXYA12_FULL_35_19]